MLARALFKKINNTTTKNLRQTHWGSIGLYLDNLTTGVAMFIVYMFRGEKSNLKTTAYRQQDRHFDGRKQTDWWSQTDTLMVISDRLMVQNRHFDGSTQTLWGLA